MQIALFVGSRLFRGFPVTNSSLSFFFFRDPLQFLCSVRQRTSLIKRKKISVIRVGTPRLLQFCALRSSLLLVLQVALMAVVLSYFVQRNLSLQIGIITFFCYLFVKLVQSGSSRQLLALMVIFVAMVHEIGNCTIDSGFTHGR